MKCPMTKTVLCTLALSILSGTTASAAEMLIARPYQPGKEKLVDNPVDAWMTAVKGPAGKPVTGVKFRKDGTKDGFQPYQPSFDKIDATDAKLGQFSVRYTVDKPKTQGAFGFWPGRYVAQWALTAKFSLHLWLKAEAESPVTGWTLALYDTGGKRAATDLDIRPSHWSPESSPRTRPPHSSLGWREFKQSLKKLNAAEGLDFGAINAVQVEAALPAGASLWLDDVTFKDGKEMLGLTEKTITRHMADASATRPLRVDEAIPRDLPFARNGFSPDKTNDKDHDRKIIAALDWLDKNDQRRLGGTSGGKCFWLYFGYSSKSKLNPGKLSPAVEERLLELIWDMNVLKNDMAVTKLDPWWVACSENMNIDIKARNLLSSQILMHEPAYAKRIYPDLGRMIGYETEIPDFAKTGPWRSAKDTPHMKLGSGNYKDGKEYNAEDHYHAWVKFWKVFFAERAKRGFFIEHNSHYMMYTIPMLHDIYAWCDDEGLRYQCKMFFDLI